MSWGYTTGDGPSTWAEKFPTAAGERQSPVDINTTLVAPSMTRNIPLTWSYEPGCSQSISNTGHGWKVEVDGSNSELIGGPLNEKHQLAQFHCHWGHNSDHGSEHTVNGEAFAGELHLVHWNSGKYATIAEASSEPDGFAVLGMLLKIGSSHPEIEKITALISDIPHKGQAVPLTDVINIPNLLPADSRCYWSYLGSLTTPPCSEVVTWILFKEPIEVSEEQLAVFRTLLCYAEGEECPCDELAGKLTANFRPPLALGGRQLQEYGSLGDNSSPESD